MFEVDLDLDEYIQAKAKTLAELGELRYKAVGRASRAGAAAAKAGGRFRDRTGGLRASIRVISARLKGNSVEGGFETKAAHANYVEYGTRPHRIRPINYEGPGRGAQHTIGKRAGKRVKNPTVGVGRGKYLRFYVGGRVVFAREVFHPGTRPDPFMGAGSVVATVTLVQVVEEGVEQLQAKIWR